MSEVINLNDVVKDLKEIRTKIQKIKLKGDKNLNKDFVEDLRNIEEEKGEFFSSKEELEKYLERS